MDRERRIYALLRLAGADPATTDPEKLAAHAKAEALAGRKLEWPGMNPRELIVDVEAVFDYLGLRR